MPPSGQVFMCGPLSVEYMTMVSSAMPSSSSLSSSCADVLVVVDHRVVVLRLPAPGLPEALRLGVRAEVHVGGVEPHEERRVGRLLALDEVERRASELSSSMVSIRFLVSGPVSSIRCLPTGPSAVVGRVVLVGRPGSG